MKMWKNNRRFILLLILIILAFFFFVKLHSYKWFSPLTIYLTFLALIFYAWETRKLRKESTRQIDIQIRPYIIPRFDRNHFIIENVGIGLAKNIYIEDKILHFPGQNERLVYSFERINIVRPRSYTTVKVLVKDKNGNELDPDNFLIYFSPEYLRESNDTNDLIFHFENIENEKYTANIEFGKEIKIKSLVKRI